MTRPQFIIYEGVKTVFVFSYLFSSEMFLSTIQLTNIPISGSHYHLLGLSFTHPTWYFDQAVGGEGDGLDRCELEIIIHVPLCVGHLHCPFFSGNYLPFPSARLIKICMKFKKKKSNGMGFRNGRGLFIRELYGSDKIPYMNHFILIFMPMFPRYKILS